MQAFLQSGKLGAPVKEKATPSVKKKSIPWVEKYRPSKIEEVAYQEEVVLVLKKALETQDIPNLLFYGPPGTGKTSTILAASKELFGDMWRNRVLELNASDERGIDVVRVKVKNFAQLTASATRPDGRPCPPFKIVILDEADSMTKPAQAALRRTMEKESRTTRFCLICNYVSRIIEPITSRCAKFRFKPLDSAILKNRLFEICEKENVKFESDAIDALIDVSEGDMRKAITYLQSVARLKGEEEMSKQDIYEIAGTIPNEMIDDLVSTCQTNSYEKIQKVLKNLIAEGYSAHQLITQMHDKFITSDEMEDQQLAAICEKLAIVDHRLMDGADEYIQIMDLCCVIMFQLCQAGS